MFASSWFELSKTTHLLSFYCGRRATCYRRSSTLVLPTLREVSLDSFSIENEVLHSLVPERAKQLALYSPIYYRATLSRRVEVVFRRQHHFVAQPSESQFRSSYTTSRESILEGNRSITLIASLERGFHLKEREALFFSHSLVREDRREDER